MEMRKGTEVERSSRGEMRWEMVCRGMTKIAKYEWGVHGMNSANSSSDNN